MLVVFVEYADKEPSKISRYTVKFLFIKRIVQKEEITNHYYKSTDENYLIYGIFWMFPNVCCPICLISKVKTASIHEQNGWSQN